MNLIIVDDCDFVSPNRVRLRDRRALHIIGVLRAEIGDVLRIGKLSGCLGTGTMIAKSDTIVELELNLSEQPPAPPRLALLLAMPRPKCFRRLLQGIVSLGIKRVAIFGAYRVEKSYWATPWLAPDALREQVLLGLEQARDTMPPVISLHPEFRPFVEDVVPGLAAGTRRIVAHPGSCPPCPANVHDPVTLAIGPEGGFTPHEAERFTEAGFEPVSVGQRVLRVEQAVPCLIGRLLPLQA